MELRAKRHSCDCSNGSRKLESQYQINNNKNGAKFKSILHNHIMNIDQEEKKIKWLIIYKLKKQRCISGRRQVCSCLVHGSIPPKNCVGYGYGPWFSYGKAGLRLAPGEDEPLLGLMHLDRYPLTCVYLIWIYMVIRGVLAVGP